MEPNLDQLTAHFGEIGKGLSDLLAGIDNQKDGTKTVRDSVWFWLQFFQIATILLSALASAVVAVGNKIPTIAPWVIVPTTLVTIFTGVSGFYDFRGEYVRQFQLAADLSRLQTSVIIDLQNAILTANSTSIEGVKPSVYVQSKYRELDALLSWYIEQRGELFGAGQE